MTALCGLMTVQLKSAVITYRLAILSLGALLGLYGVIFGFLFISLSILGMESFGIQYFDYSIFDAQMDNKDKMRRAMWRAMITRPGQITDNSVRQKR